MLRKESRLVETLKKKNDRNMTLDGVPPSATVLICDDEVVVVKALEKLLEPHYRVLTSYNAKEALQKIETHHPEVLLIDFSLPDQSGLEIMRMAQLLEPHAVRILLSGVIDLKTLSEAVNQGLIHRVVLKPWNNEEFLLDLRESLLLHKIIHERNFFEKLSHLDPLTGLHNRRSIEQRIYEELARAERHQRHFAILMIDVDKFKLTNDTKGHPAGDAILKSLAELFRQSFRNIDILGRYGGDEFLIALPDTNLTFAREVADRIRKSAESKLAQTISIGLAVFPDHADQSLSLIAIADKALLQAKQQGRNQTVVARSQTNR